MTFFRLFSAAASARPVSVSALHREGHWQSLLSYGRNIRKFLFDAFVSHAFTQQTELDHLGHRLLCMFPFILGPVGSVVQHKIFRPSHTSSALGRDTNYSLRLRTFKFSN